MKKIIKKIIPKKARRAVRGIWENDEKILELQKRVDALTQHDNRLDDLRKKVANVEHYQPTYAVSGVINESARSESFERARTIEGYFGNVAGKRLLDIGSSLGFFSFYFSDRGARSEGWESNVDNCEAARAIQAINGVPVDFKTKELNVDTINSIMPGRFDAVLVLSVFHHIIRYQGLQTTQELVAELMNKIPTMIVELAKKGEDPKLPWDKYQPEDELAIFELVKDKITVKKIGEFSNHLSENNRPMYVIEAKKKIKVGSRQYSYDKTETVAYKGSNVPFGSVRRKYYFADDYIIKQYALDDASKDENLPQILDEISTLVKAKKLDVYHMPKLIDYDISNPAFISVVIERVKGELVSENDKKYTSLEVESILKDVLHTLVDLEKAGLYHNDLRSWNVIVNKSSAWLIDYGLAAPIDKDGSSVALLWLADRLLTGTKENSKQSKTEIPSEGAFRSSNGLLKVYKSVKKNPKITLTELATKL